MVGGNSAVPRMSPQPSEVDCKWNDLTLSFSDVKKLIAADFVMDFYWLCTVLEGQGVTRLFF